MHDQVTLPIGSVTAGPIWEPILKAEGLGIYEGVHSWLCYESGFRREESTAWIWERPPFAYSKVGISSLSQNDKTYQADYREQNRDTIRQRSRAWYAANKKQVKDYADSHREQINAGCRRRYAKRKGAQA